MANVKITELPAGAALVGDELQELVQVGGNVKSPVGKGIDESYIVGLKLTWNSVSQFTVSTGAAYLTSLGRALKVQSPIVVNTSGLSIRTLYYVYLYNSGTVSAPVAAIEYSTTAINATPYFGTAHEKSGDTSRRFIGVFATNASGQVIDFIYNTAAGRFEFRKSVLLDISSPYFALFLGASKTWATVSMVNAIPPNCRLVSVILRNTDATHSVVMGMPEYDSDPVVTILNATTAYIDFPTNDSRQVAYKYDTGGTVTGGFIIAIFAFYFER